MSMKPLILVLGFCGVTLALPAPGVADRALSLQDRIEAQTAIERVYHSHRTDHNSFEQEVPASVIEAKVRTHLLQSMALETIWQTPVTSAMLKAEMKRIARNTRFPDRLEEVYAALGNDPLLIQECFVRPSLVNRLARSFFAGDREIHRGERLEAEELRDQIERGDLDPTDDHARKILIRYEAEDELHDAIRAKPHALVAHFHLLAPESGRSISLSESGETFDITVTEDETESHYRVPKKAWDSWWSETKGTLGEPVEPSLPAMNEYVPERSAASICGPDDVWENGSLDDGVPEARARHTAVWTGSEMLIWGGFVRQPAGVTFTGLGLRYDPLTDTWSYMSALNAPVGRMEHAAVWTGTEMIVWGGRQASSFNTGGRYDPVADTWVATSLVNAPSARVSHTAVWADDVMVIWGGAADNSGGRYDPQTDSWTQVSTTSAPSPRGGHVASWTGTEMLVWGGGFNTGGRYNPASDTWLAMTTVNAPPPRGPCAAVWTGTEMIIWGGSFHNTGGRYDPSLNTWTPISTTGAPVIRLVPTGVWTGNEMIVWGGQVGCCGGVTNTGGRYNPTTNTWAPTDTTHAPSERAQHSAVWTGDRMLVWGGLGHFEEGYRFDGARYDPMTNSWTPMLGTTNKPSPRYDHGAVWTGSEMVIWGGQDDYAYLGGGFHYDPLIDDWTAIDALNSPAPRINHRAVWTGNRLIIWGGYGGSHLNTGGRYDPVAGTWEPTSTVGAPSGRSGHSAVWTGNVMMVWGGSTPPTGGRYDPIADTWMPTSLTGAPSGRGYHSAVWTGSRMIVWGGWDGSTSLATGGRYDPVNDAWQATSTAGVPSGGRVHHSAVWTGAEMIVYGGSDTESTFNDGFKYRPDSDVWEPISTDENSPILSGHSAFWTGRVMIVWRGIGGRYDPARDTWSSMATLDAPPAGAHSAVWTGAEMIVWDSYYMSGTGGIYLVDTSPDDDHDGFTLCAGDCDDSSSSVYAGAAQVCDGVNNDCTDPTWPAVSGTDEGDDDGDALTECQGDCDDSDATAWGLPGVVPGLEFAGPSTLTWNPPAQPGGTMVLYDTIRATLPDGFATSMTCVESDASSTTTMDMYMPAPGAVAYYLTRAQNTCGLGSAGTASDGTPRAAGDCQPPTPMSGARLDR